jgi:hypothetical protein
MVVACIRGHFGSIRVLETWTLIVALIVALLGVGNWTPWTSKLGPVRAPSKVYTVSTLYARYPKSS